MKSLLWRAARLPWRFFEMVAHEAAPATPLTLLLRTLKQSLMLWLLFLLIGPFVFYMLESALEGARWRFASPIWTRVGLLLFIAGWLLAWWSAYFLVTRGEGTPLPAATARRLVLSGPYRWVRNPMACGSLLQSAAIGLVFGSPLVLFYTLSGGVLWHFGARPWEEFDLERRFGTDYTRYKRAVRCWIPRLRPYDSERDQRD